MRPRRAFRLLLIVRERFFATKSRRETPTNWKLQPITPHPRSQTDMAGARWLPKFRPMSFSLVSKRRRIDTSFWRSSSLEKRLIFHLVTFRSGSSRYSSPELFRRKRPSESVLAREIEDQNESARHHH